MSYPEVAIKPSAFQFVGLAAITFNVEFIIFRRAIILSTTGVQAEGKLLWATSNTSLHDYTLPGAPAAHKARRIGALAWPAAVPLIWAGTGTPFPVLSAIQT